MMTNNFFNCGRERGGKGLGVKATRMYGVSADIHWQMIGSKLCEREFIRECKEK
jgi:hypothetical protein